jgi:hypothetical protein
MHRVRFGSPRRVDDRVDAQVALARLARSDGVRLVGVPHVQRRAIARRVHGDGREPHFTAGPGDADSNLAAIRNQNLLHRNRQLY